MQALGLASTKKACAETVFLGDSSLVVQVIDRGRQEVCALGMVHLKKSRENEVSMWVVYEGFA